MAALDQGSTQASRSYGQPQYLTNADPGFHGMGTASDTMPTLQQWENIFGPAARDIKQDSQRHKRHQRWHLPDALKGVNMYLTDRVDGLITDATNSPFTSSILPYVYMESPDQKIKWNVYNFDEGIASRVPYESAARVLPQSKRSFQGYIVRHGLAIAMEHNFMVSATGRENFKNQLLQLVGSIQMTNDLDVHQALLTAPSYQKFVDERYSDNSKTFAQQARMYVDLFGMMQKTPNALDWLIEDAKTHLKTWGSQPPTFLLCNNSLTTQLTMIPERTDFFTNGPDGLKRLKQGPELPSYRGLQIINSRKFSMEAGTAPRDMLRRRVRVCQHYNIAPSENNRHSVFEFYDEDRDSMFRLSFGDLMDMAAINKDLQHQTNNFAHDWFEFAYGIGGTFLEWLTHEHSIQTWQNYFKSPSYSWFAMPLDSKVPCVNVDIEIAACVRNDRPHVQEVMMSTLQAQHNRSTKRCNVAIHVLKLLIAVVKDKPAVEFWHRFYEDVINNEHLKLKLDVINDNRRNVAAQQGQIVPELHMGYWCDNLTTWDSRINALLAFDPVFGEIIYRHHELLPVKMSEILTFTYEAPTQLGSNQLVWLGWCLGLINCAASGSSLPHGLSNENLGPILDLWSARYVHTFMNFQESFGHYLLTEQDCEHVHPWMLWVFILPIMDVQPNNMQQPFPTLTNQIRNFMAQIMQQLPGNQFNAQDDINQLTPDEQKDWKCCKRLNDINTGMQNWVANRANPDYKIVTKISHVRVDDIGIVVLRPNIEHEMLAIIMGRGGTQELGATFWGQTELSCYDDSQHGIWGMSYKYHARAFVTNERNLIRAFDVSFDGYNGGMDNTYLNWTDQSDIHRYIQCTNDRSRPYTGKSMLVMMYPNTVTQGVWPNPLIWTREAHLNIPDRGILIADDAKRHKLFDTQPELWHYLHDTYLYHLPDLFHLDTTQAADKTLNDETSSVLISYEGYLGKYPGSHHTTVAPEINHGTGHLGRCFQGVASIRMGRGQVLPRGPVNLNHIV